MHRRPGLRRNSRGEPLQIFFKLADRLVARGAAYGDFDRDGDLDILVAANNGAAHLYRNDGGNKNHWIQIRLEGTKSNRAAIGAQVTLHWNDQVQIQEVSGGSGYASQNPRRVHFGLGKDPRGLRALVRWPSGKTQVIDKPTPRQVHAIKEPS